MAYLRGQTAHVIQSVNDYVIAQLVELGWIGEPGGLPYGAKTPVTVLDYVPNPTGVPIDQNTVAFTSGDESDDAAAELGASAGGLWQTDYTLFFDVFGESPAIALRIAGDLKSILTGKLPGTSRYLPITDYTRRPLQLADGHLLEFTDVQRAKPQNSEYKAAWQVVKAIAEHTFNAEENLPAIVVPPVDPGMGSGNSGSTPDPDPEPDPQPGSQPPPPVQARTAWGTSFGGGRASDVGVTLQSFPNATVGRCYLPNGPVPWGSYPQLGALPPSISHVIVSFKGATPAQVLGGAITGQYDAMVASIPDGIDVSLAYWHEPENDDLDPAQWIAAGALLADRLPTLGRTSVHSATILMGDTLRTGADRWYCPAVERLGFDIYHSPRSPQAAAYASAKGKDWIVAEFGCSDPSTALAVDKAIVAGWADNPPIQAAYWSSQLTGGNFRLDAHPDVAQWIQGLD